MGIFDGLADAPEMNNRLPEPELGKYICLIESAKYCIPENSDTNFIKIVLDVAKPICDNEGMTPDMDGYEGNTSADRVNVCIWENKSVKQKTYYVRDLKNFICAGLGVRPKDIVESDPEPDQITKEQFQEEIVPGVLAVSPDGEPTEEAGVLDGAAFVELHVVPVTSKKTGKEHKRFDFKRNVPLEEAAEVLDDRTIKRLFGSLDNFQALISDDE